MPFVTSLLTETGHAVVELPFPPMVYGAIAVVIFAVLGFVMFSYQNVSRRHIHKTNLRDAHSAHPAPTAPEITPGRSGH